MKIRDLIAQLNASDSFAKDENPEVVVVDEDGETTYDVYEVMYNERTDQIGILLFDPVKEEN